MARRTGKSRVRGTLLVLLWIWAACVFTGLDLFVNVPEFDRVRPDFRLYQGMRVAAHAMIGEPVEAATPPALREARVPDRAAREEDDLVRVVLDERASARERRRAATELGLRGREGDLEFLMHAALPPPVREGVLLGLGETGTAWAAGQLLESASGGNRGAVAALERLRGAPALDALRPALLDAGTAPELRVSICVAMARDAEHASAGALADVLADGDTPAAVRAAAANALGRIGDLGTLPVVAASRSDPDAAVARQARMAYTRLRHRS